MNLDRFVLKEGERLDDLQRNGFHIIQDKRRFCFGIDAVMLSAFVRLKKGADCIDLGTGTGILPILLSAKTQGGHYIGLELQPESADMARRSVAGNGLTDLIEIVTGDIREASDRFGASSFDTVVTNPPYIPVGTGQASSSEARNIARQELKCDLDEVLTQTARLLRPSGNLFMVHRPERLAEIMEKLRVRHLEPKRLQFVQSQEDKAPSLMLVEALKGAASGMRVEAPIILYDAEGVYRPEIKETYGF